MSIGHRARQDIAEIKNRLAALERRVGTGPLERRIALEEAAQDRDALRAQIANVAPPPAEPEKCATCGQKRDEPCCKNCKRRCSEHDLTSPHCPPPAESGEGEEDTIVLPESPKRMMDLVPASKVAALEAEVATLRAQLAEVARERDAARATAERWKENSEVDQRKRRDLEDRLWIILDNERLSVSAALDLIRAALAPEVKP